MCVSCGREEISNEDSKAVTNVYGVIADNERNVCRWALRIAGSGKGQADLGDARRSGQATIAVTQTFNFLMNPFETIDGLQSEVLQLSFQSPRKV